MITILIPKETREGERRVALTPKETEELSSIGHEVFIEKGAGINAGFENKEYTESGATLVDDIKPLYNSADYILRVKRPNPGKEEESDVSAIPENVILLGFLDPNSIENEHLELYKNQQITSFTLDWLPTTKEAETLNPLPYMSHLAGGLAVEHAIKIAGERKNLTVIGTSSSGLGAIEKGVELGMNVTAIGTANGRNKEIIESKGVKYSDKIEEIRDADFIITTARTDDGAPLLITNEMMQNGEVKSGCHIVDLALTDGGNVEGARDDKIIDGPNNIKIINKSGYPKERPHEASKFYAAAAKNFLLYLIKIKDMDKAITEDEILKRCHVTNRGRINPLFT